MVLIFAQWCVNHDLDPLELYRKAYPGQGDNSLLKQMVELTVPKEEAGVISDATVVNALSLFGNDELSFVVSEEIEKRKTLR